MVLQLRATPVFLCSVISVCVVSKDFISITALCMGQFFLGIISINALSMGHVCRACTLSMGHCSQGVYFVCRSAFTGHAFCSWVSIRRVCTLFMGQHTQGVCFVYGSAYAGHVLCSWVSVPRACTSFMGQCLKGLCFAHLCIVSRVYKYHCLVNGSLSYGMCCVPVHCAIHRLIFLGHVLYSWVSVPRACTLFVG